MPTTLKTQDKKFLEMFASVAPFAALALNSFGQRWLGQVRE